MAYEYDLVIIGGGIGGYVAAIRAGQIGFKTALVEKEKLGGTCLHAGCIPTKTLLRSAEVYKAAKNSQNFGVVANNVVLDFSLIQKRKNDVIESLHNGVLHLMKKGKIDVYYGTGRIMGSSIFSPLPGTVSVEKRDGGSEILVPKFLMLATGSRPKQLPGLETDGNMILNSDDALQLEELPRSILIVGGGVIGVEWASIFSDFDLEVTVVEYADRILPQEDEEISKEMTRLLKKKGVRIYTKASILPETLDKDGNITIQMERNGDKKALTADKMLVSVGRTANTEDIGLENTSIELENGFIQVNSFYQTKEEHIYAVGDCIGGMQLAHVAAKEGIIAAEHMKGLSPDVLEYRFVPRAIYSNPEAAGIGLTEKEALQQGYMIKTGRFPFKGIGKALVYGESDGFMKIIADKNTDDLLGVHIIGPGATELISEASLALLLDAVPWEIASAVYPHPSLSEIFSETGLAVDGRAIHS